MDESQEQLEGVHAKLRDDSSFQFDLPEAPPPPPDIDFSWLNGFFQFLAQIIKVLGPIVFWLFVAAIVVLVLYVFFSIARSAYENWHERSGKKKKETGGLDSVDVRPDEAFARDLISEADALARTGQYAAAVRLLLHSSIRNMQEKVRQRIGISMTAREIGELGRMPDESRSALRRIIHRVEISLFGEAAVSETEYHTARQDYALFAFGERAQ